MIEHEPWIGRLYEREGIKGQRLGIVGYSPWTTEDYPAFTVDFVRGLVSSDKPSVRFFDDIAGYFRRDRATFYRRVVFFEFVPCAIGGPDHRFALATPEQAAAGCERTVRIVREQKIDKLLVFSSKARTALSKTLGALGSRTDKLGDTGFDVRYCRAGDHPFTAIGLRHPQYASRSTMTDAVEQTLALPAAPPT